MTAGGKPRPAAAHPQARFAFRASLSLCLLLSLAAAFLPAGALAAPDETVVSSRSGGTGAPNGDGATGDVSFSTSNGVGISGDGRFVAFTSAATNLVANDINRATDVFVRDHQQHTTTLVSRGSDTAAGEGAPSPLAAGGAVISAGGRHVAFYAGGVGLVAEDASHQTDLFVRNLDTKTTTLVSRASGTGQFASNGSTYTGISLSANGRYVAFRSAASNLVEGDTNAQEDVFVRDLESNTTTLVSRASDGAQANGFSDHSSISADGRYVAFYSQASNLVPGDTNGGYDIFVRDLQAGTTTLVSRPSGSQSALANSSSGAPLLSGDGRHVAFSSSASNVVAVDANGRVDVFVRDLQTHTTAVVSRSRGGWSAER